MDVLKRINKLRLDRNWSIYRLSVASGIPQSTLTNMFNRETLPSITTLECICAAFEISMSDFFAENGNYEADENELINLYRMTSNEGKQAVLSILRELSRK